MWKLDARNLKSRKKSCTSREANLSLSRQQYQFSSRVSNATATASATKVKEFWHGIKLKERTGAIAEEKQREGRIKMEWKLLENASKTVGQRVVISREVATARRPGKNKKNFDFFRLSFRYGRDLFSVSFIPSFYCLNRRPHLYARHSW